jgi:hypothetical protein
VLNVLDSEDTKDDSEAIGFPSRRGAGHTVTKLDNGNKGLAALFKDAKTLDFDSIKLCAQTNENPLVAFMTYLHSAYNFKTDIEVYSNYFYTIQELYLKENPYHNHIHGADVTQAFFAFMNQCGCEDVLKLSDDQRFAAYVATAIHDVHHPGITNKFHKKAGTTLSLLYSDQSVLEMYHCAVGFSVMTSKTHDIFKDYTKEQRNELRDLIIYCVLGTDNTHHDHHMEEFVKLVENETIE